MGHREDLLAGAKRCLIEKGYARTTARDIVAASGANLASIGYHFGSKEALLNEALIQSNSEWGEALDQAMAAGVNIDGGAASLEHFEAVWTRIVELFATHRQMWAANFETFAQIQHVPEVRAVLASGLDEARLGMADTFLDRRPETDDVTVRAVGSFYQALLTGVMAQWLIDPENAPTGKDLAIAARTIVGGITTAALHR
ncbi:TetR family transcriptional regulator [Amycolatopsis sp. WAC 01416]|uniref:TetR/AcrR family transcriptional regulator n=1 Tax=Amycolatopsis sp. WAC 01416 TaxID=2203196 RepID=UPI000F7747AE|nr:TetR/AcrR family transcriptional regulator [Amycolatopsis sp. WAC 01416]RSN34625.1 TetR family transcriptional regulator [Amycolatopsis sp. WAC 01416]